jgi:hypothetical protein
VNDEIKVELLRAESREAKTPQHALLKP